MVRVSGLQFTCEPAQKIGKRIGHMTLKGKPIDAQKTYKVAIPASHSNPSRSQSSL